MGSLFSQSQHWQRQECSSTNLLVQFNYWFTYSIQSSRNCWVESCVNPLAKISWMRERVQKLYWKRCTVTICECLPISMYRKAGPFPAHCNLHQQGYTVTRCKHISNMYWEAGLVYILHVTNCPVFTLFNMVLCLIPSWDVFQN